MKKIVAMILSLAMVLSCAACFAEAAEKTEIGTVNVNGDFKIQGAIPEGYHFNLLNQDGTSIYGMLTADDEARPSVIVSIAYAEEWSEVERLNDLSDEELAEIEASFQDEDEVTIEYTETGLGTKLMVVKEALDSIDFVDIYTIYKGYGLEFVMIPGSEELSESSIQMLIDFITEMDFVDA